MTADEIVSIIENQRKFYRTGRTLSVSYRKEQLKKLRNCILKYEAQINEALSKDLGKSASESYMCEVGMTLSEITHMLKHVGSYAKDKRVRTPLTNFASRSFVKKSPYGTVLIMSPWNYPVLLSLEPLVDAISAGNTVVLKPSAYSPNTCDILETIISECFEPGLVSVIKGGRKENADLLTQKFDYIFFTGSQAVGKIVMESAAEHLTPVTLELGGKSPCIIDKNVNIKLAAKRIVFGKYLNCGQTCVAPDYVLCHKDVKEQFIEEVIKEIKKQYGENPLDNNNYGKIINDKHYNRVMGLIDSSKVAYGGKGNSDECRIAPTVMDNVTFEDAVMQEEIFGPILPVITVDTIQEAVDIVDGHSKPLALYVFSSDKKVCRQVLSECRFGGGCINDTIIHLATSNMGFGGVGESGMGAYHGRTGFDTFSHAKSIVDKKTFIDLNMRYQPYAPLKDKLIRMFLK